MFRLGIYFGEGSFDIPALEALRFVDAAMRVGKAFIPRLAEQSASAIPDCPVGQKSEGPGKIIGKMYAGSQKFAELGKSDIPGLDRFLNTLAG